MLNDLRQYSYNIYSQGIMTYLLEKYVDKNFWLEKIRPFFNDCSINNLTDFNYSKCFTILINFSFIHFDPGSEEYNFYLKNNVIYGLRIEISTLGPFAACWYIKH
ncbi:hypothetical protein, partial [Acinetobacter baumannii]|uniref:hypothetical protein n=1 Tax=Acinetobacter baumannii TaxID=470 RepID=UPI002B22F79A